MDNATFTLMLRDKLTVLETAIEREVKRRDGIRAQLAEIAKMNDGGVYSQEHIERLRETEQAKLSSVPNNAIQNAADAYVQAIQDRHAEPLDVGDPAYIGTLQTLAAAGGTLDHLDVLNMLEQFRGNPRALRAFRAVLGSQNEQAAQHISDRMLYDSDQAARHIGQRVQAALAGGSLNALAGEIDKWARYEGLKFPLHGDGSSIDPVGFQESALRGLGPKG